METLRSKDKRGGIRVPLLAEKATFSFDNREGQADITDITNDGLFLRTSEILKPKDLVVLKLNLPGDLGCLHVNARVVRVNWAVSRKRNRENLGMGLQFSDVSPSIRKILDAYVVYLRNKQIISVSKRIIEEFFGNDGPKKHV